MSLQVVTLGIVKSSACVKSSASAVFSMMPQNKQLGGCRYLLVLGNGMHKVIRDFNKFSEENDVNLRPSRPPMQLPRRLQRRAHSSS